MAHDKADRISAGTVDGTEWLRICGIRESALYKCT